ncbi:MFS transporter, DHA2 family, metal-tetracycline-proton antiporter [Terribacillus saccharophilus]|uniref:MFS transporter, DHA2 family, metal-tetracycline-proton antiporter n=1 Tax=Terribacillus saccharophilus TaxID=361277 RepID=A0AAX2EDP3_9BACI|nr:MFS transporter, DHA2 family, metal-tetracycline-proton antiporter [Terribacillus saccharophilus]
MKSQGTSEESIYFHSKKVIVLTCIVLAFAVMNGTMFNVAIPDISESFKLTPAQVSWVVTSFTTVFAIGTLIYGKLTDFYSIRTLYTIGLSFFALGAFIGFLSPNFETLIVARILQAIGAASVPPLSFIVPTRFSQNKRGRMFGYLASTIAFSSGIGPIVGGVIGGTLHWRYIFLISMVSAFSIPLFRKWFPHESKQKGKIDFIGAALVGLTVTSLLFLITTASWISILFFTTFILLLAWRTKSTDSPFINPGMFKIRNYTVTLIISFLGNFIVLGLIFLIPIMLRGLYDLSMIEIGLILFPGAIVAGLIGQWTGRVIEIRGGQSVVKIGLLLISCGTLFISTFTGSNILLIALGLLITYLGFPLIQSGTAALISMNLTKKQNGVGMGLFNLFNFFAGAFSSALFGKILEDKDISLQINPFSLTGESLIYSNIYIMFTIIGLLSMLLFSIGIKHKKS